MDDLISREAAIKAVSEYGSVWMEYTHGMTKDEIAQEALNSAKATMIRIVKELPPALPEIIRCKGCKHFEFDHVESVNGIPLIVAHEICTRWGDGVKTSQNGYCFLAERKQDE